MRVCGFHCFTKVMISFKKRFWKILDRNHNFIPIFNIYFIILFFLFGGRYLSSTYFVIWIFLLLFFISIFQEIFSILSLFFKSTNQILQDISYLVF